MKVCSNKTLQTKFLLSILSFTLSFCSLPLLFHSRSWKYVRGCVFFSCGQQYSNLYKGTLTAVQLHAAVVLWVQWTSSSVFCNWLNARSFCLFIWGFCWVLQPGNAGHLWTDQRSSNSPFPLFVHAAHLGTTKSNDAFFDGIFGKHTCTVQVIPSSFF